MDYRVLSGSSAKNLEEQVVDLAKDGYVPQGGVAVTYLSGEWLFSQAMVKVTMRRSTYRGKEVA